MNGETLEESDRRTWAFEIDGFHLDAPQTAKSRVAEEDDVDYDDLRARVITGTFEKVVTVVELS